MTERQRRLPFGYAIIMGEIVLHQDEAESVRRIYERYITGSSYKTITAQLNGEGVCYLPGADWNKHMVKRILENRTYLGERGYPAIMTAAEFAAVERRKEANPSCRPIPREKQVDDTRYRLLPFSPTATTIRLTNEINRALERNPDTETVRPMIFALAAEKYAALKYVPVVEGLDYE